MKDQTHIQWLRENIAIIEANMDQADDQDDWSRYADLEMRKREMENELHTLMEKGEIEW